MANRRFQKRPRNTLKAKLHGIPTVSWLKSAAPKEYFPGCSNFQQVSHTSKCVQEISKIFEDLERIRELRISPELRFMVSPEARVQFSDSQRFKELSALLPIVRRKQGTGTGWNGMDGAAMASADQEIYTKYTDCIKMYIMY